MTHWLRNVFRFKLAKTSDSYSKYEELSRSQLIQKIRTLENQLNHGQKPKLKAGRPFDMSQYEQRRIALKVCYLGWRYSGFASQGDRLGIPTVEDQLFRAFESSRLITGPHDCDFSRCGRTDKGVSGLGQVISLNVRSNRQKGIKESQELGYLETLNKLLPDDIRVLAWAPVKPSFNARFDCKSRTYKYFFEKGKLDLDRMREAASYMIGQHDFRNFCRLDPSKNITNYERTIVYLEIKHVTEEMYEVELKGTAFLWHQVRCIMAILFLVGQRLEDPTVVKALLDINKVPAKPDYPMASELPLMLYDCEFENLNWHYAKQIDTVALPTPLRTFYHLHELWSSFMIKGLLYKTCIDHVNRLPISDSTLSVFKSRYEQNQSMILLGAGKTITSKTYKKLLDRPTADSDQLKKEKYRKKQLKKALEK